MTKKYEPKIARALQDEDIISILSDRSMMEDVAWALHDWVEAAHWLNERNVPLYTEEGNWNSMVERIKWMIENAKSV